jgi:hypothetical protein
VKRTYAPGLSADSIAPPVGGATQDPKSPEAKAAAKLLADKLEPATDEERTLILAEQTPDYDYRAVLNVFFDRASEFAIIARRGE